MADMVADGHVWLLYHPEKETMTYAYTEEEKASIQAQGYNELELIPWRVEKLFTKTVARDRAWYEGTRAKREEFWEIVGAARRGEIQPFEVKSKQKLVVSVFKEGVCHITDDMPETPQAQEPQATQELQAQPQVTQELQASPMQPLLGIGSVLYTASPRSCMGVEQESGSPLL